MMFTDEGYNKIISLDSIRAVRVFLKLAQLSNDEGNIKVTQSQLSHMLNLKNKANVNIASAELIQKNFIKKKIENRSITYFINPNLFVTQKGYEVLQGRYNILDTDLDKLLDELKGGMF